MPIFIKLPEDVLLRIVSFLSPPDVVGLRQVSKVLYLITSQPLVWIYAYKKAAFPRPPGPYARPNDKEAMEFLEHTLVRSANLEPWISRQFQPAPHYDRTFSRIGDHVTRSHFPSWGSWFITAIGRSVVYCNLDDDPQTRVLYRLDGPNEFVEVFKGADTVSLSGHPITYVLVGGWNRPRATILLKIVGHYGTSLSVESAMTLSFPRHDLIRDMVVNSRYVCLTGVGASDGEFKFALIDVTTEKIYRLPSLKSTVEPEIHKRLEDPEDRWQTHTLEFRVHVTDTHILVAFSTGDSKYHLLAFPLPSDTDSDMNVAQDHDNGVLHLTHKGICKIESPRWVLRGNVVTNIGGVESTQIRLMTFQREEREPTHRPQWEYIYNVVDLTLSPSPADGVGTIMLSRVTPLMSFKNEGIKDFMLASSQEGFGRGVCRLFVHTASNAVRTVVQTFSLDASGESCRIDFGPRTDVTKLGSMETQFDAWNGRMCCAKEYVSAMTIHKFV